jgi:ubiquinone/menaquinone biosynthesis C-methylase UbiE
MYNHFASSYDRIMNDTADYDGVFARYIKECGECGKNRDILLDLGCGTGQLSVRFAGAGYDVIGVDISDECLSIAADRAGEEVPGFDIRFVKQDIRKLDMYGTVKVTVAAFDVINHLKALRDIRACFERVALFTEPGGLFLMDYNTPYFHHEILASNTFNYDSDDLFVSREYSCDDRNVVTVNINIFERQGENYRRYEEQIVETAYPKEVITKLLEQAGFLVAVTDFYDGGKPHDKSKRLLFSAKKA